MIKYTIDYQYGRAEFHTEERDNKKAMGEFVRFASECFGIRKSLGKITLVKRCPWGDLPLEYQGKGATHYLSHDGDEILFDDRYSCCSNGDSWKLLSESENWCTCKERGKPELACEVHHFWVEEHDKICDCHNKKKEE